MCLLDEGVIHVNSHLIAAFILRFFDIYPVGRVLNRFSKDLGAVDELLPPAMASALDISLVVAASVAINVANVPPLALPAALILAVFFRLRVYYLATSRDGFVGWRCSVVVSTRKYRVGT